MSQSPFCCVLFPYKVPMWLQKEKERAEINLRIKERRGGGEGGEGEEVKMRKQREAWHLRGGDGAVKSSREAYNNMKSTSSTRSHSYLHTDWSTIVQKYYIYVIRSFHKQPNCLCSLALESKLEFSVDISELTCIDKSKTIKGSFLLCDVQSKS